MNDQTDAEPSEFWDQRHADIGKCCPLGMQWMKPNAASVGVENGRGGEMVEVDDHAAKCLPAARLPALFADSSRECGRKCEVQNHVKEETHGLGS